jgi:hypothetical protein
VDVDWYIVVVITIVVFDWYIVVVITIVVSAATATVGY